jgi:hypothetical protein
MSSMKKIVASALLAAALTAGAVSAQEIQPLDTTASTALPDGLAGLGIGGTIALIGTLFIVTAAIVESSNGT